MTPLQQVTAGLGLTAILMFSVSCGRANPAYGMQSTNQATNLPQSTEDPLERESKKLAGPSAMDCGRVEISGNPKTATDCALAAQKAGKPFRIRYELQGVDSEVAVAIVRTPAGIVSTLSYDSLGMPVLPRPCPVPVQFSVTRSGRINCFPPDPSKHPDAMSPTAEPY
jgi:hypothetical protein